MEEKLGRKIPTTVAEKEMLRLLQYLDGLMSKSEDRQWMKWKTADFKEFRIPGREYLLISLVELGIMNKRKDGTANEYFWALTVKPNTLHAVNLLKKMKMKKRHANRHWLKDIPKTNFSHTIIDTAKKEVAELDILLTKVNITIPEGTVEARIALENVFGITTGELIKRIILEKMDYEFFTARDIQKIIPGFSLKSIIRSLVPMTKKGDVLMVDLDKENHQIYQLNEGRKKPAEKKEGIISESYQFKPLAPQMHMDLRDPEEVKKKFIVSLALQKETKVYLLTRNVSSVSKEEALGIAMHVWKEGQEHKGSFLHDYSVNEIK
jgi:hypothetical protein